jgi:hypothetical protein
MSTMSTLDKSGDTRVEWDPEVPAEVEAARAHFDTMTRPPSRGGKGYLAYTPSDGDGRGEQIREFDPEAGEIVLVQAPVGG